jgi:hypothetical protein
MKWGNLSGRSDFWDNYLHKRVNVLLLSAYIKNLLVNKSLFLDRDLARARSLALALEFDITRAFALVFDIAYADARDIDRAHADVRDRAGDIDRARALARDIDRARGLALARDIDRNLALDRALVKELSSLLLQLIGIDAVPDENKWDVNENHVDILGKYVDANELMQECLIVAVVDDRQAIIDHMYLSPGMV